MCKFVNNAKHSRIDRCMKQLCKFLVAGDYWVVACCCGHEKYTITIIVRYQINGKPTHVELLTGLLIPRTRNFYSKDEEGIYYIREVIKNHTPRPNAGKS